MGRILVLFLSVSVLGACWSDKDLFDSPVWSEDDQEIALVRKKYEEQENNLIIVGSNPTRDHRFQVHVQDADGTNQKSWGGWSNGYLVSSLYYMAAEGFVLAQRADESKWNEYIVQLHRSDDTVDELLRWDTPTTGYDCTNVTVVPSPDGTILAILEEPSGCQDFSATLRFVDPDDLTELDSESLTFGSATVASDSRYLTHSWDNDNQYIITSRTSKTTTYAYSPGKTPVEVDDLTCDYPRTSSSTNSASGEIIGMVSDTETGVMWTDGDTFPCF